MIASALGLGIGPWLEEGRELAAEADEREAAGDIEASVNLRFWAIEVFDEGTAEAQRQAMWIGAVAAVLVFLLIVSVVA